MKQILISSDSNDNSTDDVISWLYYKDKNVKIDNLFDTTKLNNFEINLSSKNKISLKLNNIVTNNNYWYRRGELFYENNLNLEFKGIHNRLYNENINPLLNFINGIICNNQINKYNDNYSEKLEMLRICLENKLNIPDVLITSNLNSLKKFVMKHKKVITKPVKNPSLQFNIYDKKLSLTTSTKMITINDILYEKQDFLPSFFQKYIEKKIEIRSFYLDGNFKSMAIFSQQNEKTKIDFRNYDYERPNRCVPYMLPKSIEKKLHKLMLKLNINCGSFDLIYTPSGKYYFLEVNPIGQFQWLSKNCNYFIEKLIAEKLLN